MHCERTFLPSSFGEESSRFRRRSVRLGLLSEISSDQDIEEANNLGRCEDGNKAAHMSASPHNMCLETPSRKWHAAIGGCF